METSTIEKLDKDELIKIIERLIAENQFLKKENENLKQMITKLEQDQGGASKQPPAFVKPNKKRRRRKRGRKPGFKGTSRRKPEHIDKVIDLTLAHCPECGTLLGDAVEVKDRYVEDIVPARNHIVKQYNIHKYYCPRCKKKVYSKPVDVIPHFHFGLVFVLFICFQKFGLGLTYNKIAFELKTYFGIEVSEGTLCNTVKKAAELFGPKFEELKQELRELKEVNIDETGWRVDGQNHWLWAFISEKMALYVIDKSRGHKVPEEMLGDGFDGIVGCDFFSAYNALGGKQQKSWVHLLRETSKLADKDGASEEIKRFHRRMKRLYRDAVRFKATGPSEEEKERAQKRLLRRLDKICEEPYEDEDCQRLAKRLQKHRENMFRFVVMDGVEPDNNRAERGIRPNVVMRKISGGNRSDGGAEAHGIMMSIIQTNKLQGKNFFEEGMAYLQDQLFPKPI